MRYRKNTQLLELGSENALIERLHDILVRTGLQRARDMVQAVLRRAEDDIRSLALRCAAQLLEEAVAVHDRHVPVEEDHVRHLGLAGLQARLPVPGFGDPKDEALDDFAGYLADHAGVINDQ